MAFKYLGNEFFIRREYCQILSHQNIDENINIIRAIIRKLFSLSCNKFISHQLALLNHYNITAVTFQSYVIQKNNSSIITHTASAKISYDIGCNKLPLNQAAYSVPIKLLLSKYFNNVNLGVRTS